MIVQQYRRGKINSYHPSQLYLPAIALWGCSVFSMDSKCFLAFLMFIRVAVEAEKRERPIIIRLDTLEELTDIRLTHDYHDVCIRCKPFNESRKMLILHLDCTEISSYFATGKFELLHNIANLLKPDKRQKG